MSHNTKNFLEITDIDISNQLLISIELVTHNDPKYIFTVNDIPLLTNIGTFKLDLLSDIEFKCTTQTGAVEVAKITINGKEIMPVYQHLADPATSWITHNWKFFIPGPFYPWYHQITGQGWIA